MTPQSPSTDPASVSRINYVGQLRQLMRVQGADRFDLDINDPRAAYDFIKKCSENAISQLHFVNTSDGYIYNQVDFLSIYTGSDKSVLSLEISDLYGVLYRRIDEQITLELELSGDVKFNTIVPKLNVSIFRDKAEVIIKEMGSGRLHRITICDDLFINPPCFGSGEPDRLIRVGDDNILQIDKDGFPVCFVAEKSSFWESLDKEGNKSPASDLDANTYSELPTYYDINQVMLWDVDRLKIFHDDKIIDFEDAKGNSLFQLKLLNNCLETAAELIQHDLARISRNRPGDGPIECLVYGICCAYARNGEYDWRKDEQYIADIMKKCLAEDPAFEMNFDIEVSDEFRFILERMAAYQQRAVAEVIIHGDDSSEPVANGPRL